MRINSEASQKLSGDPTEIENILINPLSKNKSGNDSIFAWHNACEIAKREGREVINATLGSMLDDSGNLSVNKVVQDIIRKQGEHDYSAYAPLKGVDNFRNIAIMQTLGNSMYDLTLAGMCISSIATPGGCGALYASANTFAAPGSTVLLRDQHWMPYETILTENQLSWKNWDSYGTYEKQNEDLMIESFNFELNEISKNQDQTLIWINDPAHNPTGRTFTPNTRMGLLKCLINEATEKPNKGYTFLIDCAYSAYSDEKYGWSETISQWIKNESIEIWPNNLLICFAYSASKSHTIYGLRLGALIVMHPNQKFIERMEEILLHTGRGTWSAAPRLPQMVLTKIHTNPLLEEEWDSERLKMKEMLDSRRESFVSLAKESNIPMFRTDEGYFAFVHCENPVDIATKCATEGVYVVPLSKGIRIGICAVPQAQMGKIVDVLSKVL